jgi:hypothetical protein
VPEEYDLNDELGRIGSVLADLVHPNDPVAMAHALRVILGDRARIEQTTWDVGSKPCIVIRYAVK